MIGELIDAGNAYPADDHVLFHVPSDPEYGTLAKRSLEHMLDGARVEVAPYKEDPKDFVLWKPSTPDLPGWPSPWGRGRPGWHIECSAMIRRHLGPVIDIHGGGSDLKFPHHENEAAQSRCANGGGLTVRYWLHNGMLTMAGEKMSKSLGNIVTIRELLARHDGETLRYALLSGHYRQSLTWSESLISQAKASLATLYGALRDTENGGRAAPDAVAPPRYPESVLDALCDDLNTPQALAAMHALATEIRRAEDAERIGALRAQLLAGGTLLGILGKTPDALLPRRRRGCGGHRRVDRGTEPRAQGPRLRPRRRHPGPVGGNGHRHRRHARRHTVEGARRRTGAAAGLIRNMKNPLWRPDGCPLRYPQPKQT